MLMCKVVIPMYMISSILFTLTCCRKRLCGCVANSEGARDSTFATKQFGAVYLLHNLALQPQYPDERAVPLLRFANRAAPHDLRAYSED